MLAIQPVSSSPHQHQQSPSAPPTLIPHLLPCTIRHDGPIAVSPRYWNPQQTKKPYRPAPAPSDNTEQKTPEAGDDEAEKEGAEGEEEEESQTVYLRGRKLLGKSVKLPPHYTGVVLQKTEEKLARERKVPARPWDVQSRGEEEDEEDEDEEQEVGLVRRKGVFDEIVVWGHEAVPEDENVYVRGMEEWIGFAEAMHAYDAPTGDAELNR